MDLFFRGVSPATSEVDFRITLASIIHKPPFPLDPPTNFYVVLHRRRNGKDNTTGNLIFPTAELGEIFLRSYGSTGVPCQGRRIYFSISNRPVDGSVVQRLQSTVWEDPEELRKKKEKLAKLSEPIELEGFSFGFFCRDGSFSSEVTAPGRPEISCDFDDRRVLLTLHPGSVRSTSGSLDSIFNVLAKAFGEQLTHTTAEYSRPKLHSLLISKSGASDGVHNLFLRSHSAPIFMHHISNQKQRWPALSADAEMPPHCHSMCLNFKTRDDLLLFVARCRRLDLHSETRRTVIIRRNSYSLLKELQTYIATLDFDLAFQIEKAVTTTLLTPKEVLSLKSNIHSLALDFGNRAWQIFQRFSSMLSDMSSAQNKFRNKNGFRRETGNTHEGLSLAELLEEAIKTFTLDNGESSPVLSHKAGFHTYRLILTPSTYHLDGPFPDQSNSVVRRFLHPECFLRVSLQDENRSKIRNSAQHSITGIVSDRFRQALISGRVVAGRQYEFLAFSMSGLKEHTLWFMTPFEKDGVRMDAQAVRAQLGDFTPLAYQPARLSARWSQNFSATYSTLTLEESHIMRNTEDRYSTSNKIMTDGCSSVSPGLAKDIYMALKGHGKKSHKATTVPSAFQFRIGGAKGMIVQNPQLSGKVLCLRNSQTKYEASNVRTFDVQSTSSRPRNMYLNRPLILLLEYLGTDSSRIIKLQDHAIKEVQHIHESFLDASKMFQQHGFGASFGLPSLFRSLSTVLNIPRIWSSPQSPGFKHDVLQNAMLCASSHALRELKYRAHIPVPGSYSLLGVSDEWGCLREGEIYATVRNERTGLYKAIEGRVAITRSPQLHPGDIRFATAVRRPELNHLTNVVVFSCEGDRSLASCLAGGDLDGDDFNIILDEGLFPNPGRICTPGSYTSAPIRTTASPCTVVDVIDFIVNYIASDLLGVIAIAHMRWADLKDPGCEECLKLADLASHAVDFPKTGTPVNFKDIPQFPRSRPDFLVGERIDGGDPANEETYNSQKLLGILFRRVPAIDVQSAQDEDIEDDYPDAGLLGAFSVRDALHHKQLTQLGLPDVTAPGTPPAVDIMEEMRHLLEAYCEQLSIIGRAHSISRNRDARVSEGELVSGTIVARWADHRKRLDATNAMNFQTHKLVKSMRQAFRALPDTQNESSPDLTNQDTEAVEDDYSEDDDSDDEYYFSDSGTPRHRGEKQHSLSAEQRSALAGEFTRAWVAWCVSEDAMPAFGAASFGLIALGCMVDVIRVLEVAPGRGVKIQQLASKLVPSLSHT